MTLQICPSVGIARLGNSTGQFYLAPDEIGGLPYEADAHGNKKDVVEKFKNEKGEVRKQGQLFKLFLDGEELTLDSANVLSMVWTVHLANKKAAWYQYSELEGNLLYGEQNSYKNRQVELRNNKSVGEKERQSLIVDPGPRQISGREQSVELDKTGAPAGYPVSFPPEQVQHGTPVKTLGTLLTDSKGRLVALGGYGHAGGNEPLTSYGGSDSWHDDIADGPVYCEVTFKDGTSKTLQAWLVVGSPDFAPEIVNISTLSDTMFDVGVRKFNLVPEMCKDGVYQKGYVANYKRDIEPLIKRFIDYQWVANVQSMAAFSSHSFDYADNSEENRENRETYFSYFRRPNDKQNPSPDQPQAQLFKQNDAEARPNIPMMPLNSGSNSVSNINIVKFLALDETQYFLLSQWADGKFESQSDYVPHPVNVQDQASVGNCVGLPMCPGIEVTWSVQNPAVYEAPYVIKDKAGKDGYNQTGLTPSRDECEGGGCEPGDLTKRMACPWQADFFQCTVQPVNFTDPAVNKADGTPQIPTYYSYWWPPQSPWDVLMGEVTAEGQQQSHLPAGQQMNYARGINSFVQMVEHWSALAFIRNINAGQKDYPYFTETERNHEIFGYKEVGVGEITGNPADNETTLPVFFIESPQNIADKGAKAKLLVSAMEERAFKPIAVKEGGLGMPRSGTRSRR